MTARPDPRSQQPADASAPQASVLHPNDVALVRRVVAGSVEARREFATRMHCVPRMLAARNRRLHHPFSNEDLEDLTQDTLVSIWKRLPDFEGRASLETWAYRFCQHQVANRLRVRGNRPTHVGPEQAEAVAAQVALVAEHEEVHQGLERLDPRDAEVLRLKHFNQLSFEEMAAHLGQSANTIKSRYYRACTRMHDLLAPIHQGLAS